MSNAAQKIMIKNPDLSEKQLSTDSSGNLNVNIAAGSTSGGALETGGNLATLASKVPVPTRIASGTDLAGTAYTSTASYASCIGGAKAIVVPYKMITINVKEANVNAIMYQILGYTEASGFTRPMVLATALDVAKNGSDYQVVNIPLLGIDVQAIDKVGATHGSVVCDVVVA